jgi:hypothetical protein
MAEVIPGHSGTPYPATIRASGDSQGIDAAGSLCGHSEQILIIADAISERKREDRITLCLQRDEAIKLIADMARALTLSDPKPTVVQFGERIT